MMHRKSTRLKKGEPSALQSKTNQLKLQDHTSKIQQKLAKLKSEVQEKRTITNKNRFIATTQSNNTLKSKPSQRRRTQTGIKNNNAQIIEKIKCETNLSNNSMDNQLKEFISSLGYIQYEELLIQNGVDSIAILQQIKQQELQQIGIHKGHALKITVKLKKLKQQKNNKSHVKQKEQIKNSKKQQSKADEKKQPLEIVIQTQPINQQQPLKKRRYFCLYCYKITDQSFCNDDCEFMYNKMFSKYESNLAKAEEQYGHQNQQQDGDQAIQGPSMIDEYDVLEILENDESEPQLSEQYHKVKQLINELKVSPQKSQQE